MIANIGNIERTFPVECDTVRLIELSFGRGPAIAAESLLSGPRNRRNPVRLLINATHNVISHFHEDHVTVSVKADLIGLIEFGLRRWTAIARITLFAVPSNCRQFARLQ